MSVRPSITSPTALSFRCALIRPDTVLEDWSLEILLTSDWKCVSQDVIWSSHSACRQKWSYDFVWFLDQKISAIKQIEKRKAYLCSRVQNDPFHCIVQKFAGISHVNCGFLNKITAWVNSISNTTDAQNKKSVNLWVSQPAWKAKSKTS